MSKVVQDANVPQKVSRRGRHYDHAVGWLFLMFLILPCGFAPATSFAGGGTAGSSTSARSAKHVTRAHDGRNCSPRQRFRIVYDRHAPSNWRGNTGYLKVRFARVTRDPEDPSRLLVRVIWHHRHGHPMTRICSARGRVGRAMHWVVQRDPHASSWTLPIRAHRSLPGSFQFRLFFRVAD